MASKVAKYATHGAVSAGIYQYIMNPSASKIELAVLGGKQVPLWAVAAAMGVGASVVSDIAADFILPQVSSDKKLVKLEGAAVTLAAGGASYVAMGYVANPALIGNEGQLKSLFITGAVSELAAQWVYENVVSVYMY